MLVPPLDGTIRVPSVIGVNLGSRGHGGIDLAELQEDLAELQEDLEAFESHGHGSYVTKAKFLAELRPIRTVVYRAVGTALAGVAGAASRLAPR